MKKNMNKVRRKSCMREIRRCIVISKMHQNNGSELRALIWGLRAININKYCIEKHLYNYERYINIEKYIVKNVLNS